MIFNMDLDMEEVPKAVEEEFTEADVANRDADSLGGTPAADIKTAILSLEDKVGMKVICINSATDKTIKEYLLSMPNKSVAYARYLNYFSDSSIYTAKGYSQYAMVTLVRTDEWSMKVEITSDNTYPKGVFVGNKNDIIEDKMQRLVTESEKNWNYIATLTPTSKSASHNMAQYKEFMLVLSNQWGAIVSSMVIPKALINSSNYMIAIAPNSQSTYIGAYVNVNSDSVSIGEVYSNTWELKYVFVYAR